MAALDSTTSRRSRPRYDPVEYYGWLIGIFGTLILALLVDIFVGRGENWPFFLFLLFLCATIIYVKNRYDAYYSACDH